MTLKFNEGNHSYWLDGKRIQGVTTILGAGIPKPALPYWAAKSVAEYVIDNRDKVEALWEMGGGSAVAALKQVPWTKRDEAAVKGTAIHAIAEELVHGREVDVPDHLLPYVEGYVSLIEEFQIEPLFTELPVAHRLYRYGGKFDIIAKIGAGPWEGRTALIDWKSSKGVYGETCLQTAAYASAEFMLTDEGEQPLPAVDCTAVVHVTEFGSTLHSLSSTPDEIAEAFNVFRHVQYLAQKQDWIKARVGEAMTIEGIAS